MIDATTHRFDTFVFDLDGTLLDTLPDLVVLTNAVLRECGFPERTSAEILSSVSYTHLEPARLRGKANRGHGLRAGVR